MHSTQEHGNEINEMKPVRSFAHCALTGNFPSILSILFALFIKHFASKKLVCKLIELR